MKLDTKSLYLVLSLLSTINAKALMQEEPEEIVTQDVESQLIMTTTTQVAQVTETIQATPTEYIDNNVVDTVIPFECTTPVYYDSSNPIARKYNNCYDMELTTQLPADVDEAVVKCVYTLLPYSGEPLKPVICNKAMNCYRAYDSFVTAGNICKLYTSKTNDAIPSKTEYGQPINLCTIVTETPAITLSRISSNEKTIITHEGEEYTRLRYINTYITEKGTKTYHTCTYPQAVETTSEIPTSTVTVEPTVKDIYVPFKLDPQDYQPQPRKVHVPANVEKVDVSCSYSEKKYYSNSAKSIPKILESMNSNNTSTTTTATVNTTSTYCNKYNQNECYGYYTTSTVNNAYLCTFYTDVPVPTTSVPVKEVCNAQPKYRYYVAEGRVHPNIPERVTNYYDGYVVEISDNYLQPVTTTFTDYECQTESVQIEEVPIETSKEEVTSTVIEEQSTSTISETIETLVINQAIAESNDVQCSGKYEQCGGINYNGPTCCENGTSCKKYNDYYSQCI